MTSEERGWSAGSRGLRVELLDTELAKAAAEALVRVRSASPVDAIVMASAARRVEQPGSPDGASASADEGLQTNSWFANEPRFAKRNGLRRPLAHVCPSTTESQTAGVNRAAAVTSGAAAERDTPSCTSPTNVHFFPRNVRVRPRAPRSSNCCARRRSSTLASTACCAQHWPSSAPRAGGADPGTSILQSVEDAT